MITPTTCKPRVSLGLSVASKDGLPGVFVTKIQPGSTAAESGEIVAGLRIVAINQIDLFSAAKMDVVQHLTVPPSTELKITFVHDDTAIEELEQNLGLQSLEGFSESFHDVDDSPDSQYVAVSHQ
eukprot:m.214777 g.214777  ORF g.214777 m.214777 type:complete len:125 (+) comp33177_c0_seq22:1881-2255(+)